MPSQNHHDNDIRRGRCFSRHISFIGRKRKGDESSNVLNVSLSLCHAGQMRCRDEKHVGTIRLGCMFYFCGSFMILV